MSTDEAARTDEQADRECGRCRYARPYNPLTVVSNAHNGWGTLYRDLWIECRRDGLGNERHWRAGAWDGVALLCDDYEVAPAEGVGASAGRQGG